MKAIACAAMLLAVACSRPASPDAGALADAPSPSRPDAAPSSRVDTGPTGAPEIGGDPVMAVDVRPASSHDARDLPPPPPDDAADATAPPPPDDAGDAGAAPPPLACGACAEYAPPQAAGRLNVNAIDELSGLVASRAHPGIVYGHNDTKGVAEVFALRETGEFVGRFVLTPSPPKVDTEDIALGPCGDRQCLYLGDIGDNTRIRQEYAIFQLEEPVTDVCASPGAHEIPFRRFRFVYPDGPHDSEAMLVDPTSGAVYLITKEPIDRPSAVFRLPLPLSEDIVNTAVKVTTLPIPRVGDHQLTAADAHPCERRVLVRTYRALFELRAPGVGAFEDVFSALPVRLSVANEPQGEAVAYLSSGRGYVTASEGTLPVVSRALCRGTAAPPPLSCP